MYSSRTTFRVLLFLINTQTYSVEYNLVPYFTTLGKLEAKSTKCTHKRDMMYSNLSK